MTCRLQAIALAVGLALVAGQARATSLAIAPTTVEIAKGRRSAVIEIVNEEDAPVDLQFRAYAWSQPDGDDRLVPTDDVVVSPAIVTVAPHGKQLFRVLSQTAAAAPGERSYRLRINQLPKAADRAVGINVEFLLPLFTGGGGASHLTWSMAGGRLRVANDGGQRIKLDKLDLRLPDGRTLAIPEAASAYILANGARSWPLKTAIPTQARLIGIAGTALVDVTPDVVATPL